jgi:peptidoglycan-associated lipoprotein
MLTVGLVGCARRPATTLSAPASSGAAFSNGFTAAPTRFDDASRPAPHKFAAHPALKDVHFDFDRYEIRPVDAKILDQSAAWLRSNPGYAVMIEGHTDERGTNEYNTTLGDRRAKSTVNYLVSRGVASSRIHVVSFGEERPTCSAHTEPCWAKNRRARTLVSAQ